MVLEPASASFPGVITTGAQSFAGTKTFTNVNTTPWSFGGGNEMWALTNNNAPATGYINYSGYNGGVTMPRSTVIGNGQGAPIATFNGVNSVATFTNPINGSITGNAATVTTVPALSGVVFTTGTNNVTQFSNNPTFPLFAKAPYFIFNSKFTDADSGMCWVQNGTTSNFAMREKAGNEIRMCRTGGLTPPFTFFDLWGWDNLGHLTIEGVKSTGATGTSKFVFSNSPQFTGVPTAPTPPPTSNDNTVATTAFFANKNIALNPATGIISTTETVIASTPFIAANRLLVGTVLRFTLKGKNTSTASGANAIRLRYGSTGTLTDSIVMFSILGVSASTGTDVPFSICFEISIKAVSVSGNCNIYLTLLNNGNTGISSLQTPLIRHGYSIPINTTTDGIMSLTYNTGNAGTGSKFTDVFFETLCK